MTPVSTIWPPYMTTTRSVTSATSARSCETRISAKPSSARSRSSSSITCACTVTSSAVVGSSATISLGSRDSAIAMSTRCRCPPDSSCGYADSVRVGSRPTSSSSSVGGARAAAPDDLLELRADGHRRVQRATARPGRSSPCRGRAAAAGAGCGMREQIPARRSRISPRTRASRGCRPMMVSAVSDLPQPDSPTRPSTSPGRTSKRDAVDDVDAVVAVRRTRSRGPAPPAPVRRWAAAGRVRPAAARPRPARAAR